MKNPFPYYPLVGTDIQETLEHFDIEIYSNVRKKVNDIYIECMILKALRFTNKVDNEMSKFDKVITITDFINKFHLDIAVFLETNKFDVNDKIEVISDDKKIYSTQVSVSNFQMPQNEYVKSLKTK